VTPLAGAHKLGTDPVDDRLDEEKIELLQGWADGLLRDERSEVRAAAKAILLLVDEIEHLHVDLWHAREAGAPDEPTSPPTLRAVLARRLRAAQEQPEAE
jgi:hypothetical protein